jgi:hypothetical protein
MNRLWIAFAVVLAVVVGWWAYTRPRQPPPTPARAPSPPPQPASRTASPAHGGRSDQQIAEGQQRYRDLERQLHEAEAKRRAARSGGGERGTLAGEAGGVPGTLDAPYIKSRIADIAPLLKECYENALRTSPQLGGRMVVKFTIVGDHELGGIVERAEVARSGAPDAGEIGISSLDECITATIESVTFAPPAGDGRVNVTYPFVFRSDEPAAEK